MTIVTPTTSSTDIGSVLWIVEPAAHDRPAPVGALGVLVIEGPSVGREYLN